MIVDTEFFQLVRMVPNPSYSVISVFFLVSIFLGTFQLSIKLLDIMICFKMLRLCSSADFFVKNILDRLVLRSDCCAVGHELVVDGSVHCNLSFASMHCLWGKMGDFSGYILTPFTLDMHNQFNSAYMIYNPTLADKLVGNNVQRVSKQICPVSDCFRRVEVIGS